VESGYCVRRTGVGGGGGAGHGVDREVGHGDATAETVVLGGPFSCIPRPIRGSTLVISRITIKKIVQKYKTPYFDPPNKSNL